MARIRTVKPDFFRDEDLQDLEAANPGKNCMLVFAALWGHSDKNGNFEWKPRILKLDILPFLNYDMEETLAILADAGFVKKYGVKGQDYGHIPTFEEHQRICGKEAQEPARFPKFPGDPQLFPGEADEKQQGEQERKGREGKGIGGTAHAVPYSEIVDAYNRIMLKIPKVRDLGEKRKKLIKSAWLEGAERQSLQFWTAYFEECSADNFLNGTGPYRNGHENWQPTFDYLLRADVVTKVYEKAMHRVDQSSRAH